MSKAKVGDTIIIYKSASIAERFWNTEAKVVELLQQDTCPAVTCIFYNGVRGMVFNNEFEVKG